MDVKVTITCDDKALAFSENLKAFAGAVNAGGIEKIVKETAQEMKVINPAVSPEPVNYSNQKKAEAPKETVQEKAQPVKKEEKSYTLEEVRSAATKYMTDHGRDAFKSALAKFGAKKLTDIKSDQYGDFMGVIS